MKEKGKNGCNILIMTFPNLEKCMICMLKTTTSTPPPPTTTSLSSKVEGIFAPKKSPEYGCYLQLNMPIQQKE